MFCFCCILAPLNFTQNFLENAVIEIPENLQAWRQICKLQDPGSIFQNNLLMPSNLVFHKTKEDVITLPW